MFVIISTANFIAKLKFTFSLWNTINYFMLTWALRNFSSCSSRTLFHRVTEKSKTAEGHGGLPDDKSTKCIN